MTLKRDGRRVSLEGVLSGSALGILLIYLVEEAAVAAGRPRPAGPIDVPEAGEPGPFRTRVGAIPIAPLAEIELGLSGARRPLGSGGDPGIGAGGGGGELALPRGEDSTARPAAAPVRLNLAAGSAVSGGAAAGGTAGGSADPPAPPQPPDPEPPTPEPDGRALPQVVLVLVRTQDQVSSRALSNQAASSQTPSQRGIAYSTLNLREAGVITLEVLSDRRLQGAGINAFDDASLAMIASNAAVLGSQLLGGSRGDVYLLSARDFLSLSLVSGAQADTWLEASAAALVDSQLDDAGGNNLLALQATTQLSFTALGDMQRASLTFDLLAQGLRDAAITLGEGDDRVTIVSGFISGQGVIGLAAGSPGGSPAEADGGLRFFLPEPALQPGSIAGWSFALNASAIGLQDSSLSTGAGNDSVVITTRIDEQLAADLGGLVLDPGTSISLRRIGLLRSSLSVGAGDDLVRINGAVIDSSIDLGDGDNTLILEGPLSGSSRILSGPGRNRIVIDGNLGGSVSGGSGADRFDLNSLALAGLLDGGAGDDSLSSGRAAQRDFARIQGRDQGFLGGLQFRSIEGLDLGGGDDVVLMNLEGTLTGRLLGGSGLDRLEFSNWELPVAVDLDLGSATAIYGSAAGGISGFEQVFGGLGPDRLAASGLHAGLDGNDGDDVLFLRWTPWLSGQQAGLELRGGGGRDLFVIAGLEAAIPAGWDGVSGIPTLSDLRLAAETGGASSGDLVGWLRQVSGSDGDRQEFLNLTPSGLEGLGDARLLPIAPLEQLLSGMADATRQLAIALDAPGGTSLGELHLLGSDGPGTSRLIAYVPGAALNRETQAVTALG